MAWLTKGLTILLVILLCDKMFGFDPGERITAYAETRWTSAAVGESTSVIETHVSGKLASESATAVPQSESRTTISQSGSGTSIPQLESITAFTQSESTQTVPLSKSTQTVPLSESTQTVPLSKSTQTVPLFESTQTVPLSESTQTVPLSESTQTVPQSEVTQTVPLYESTQTVPQSEVTQTVVEFGLFKTSPLSESISTVHHSEHMTPIPQSDSTLAVHQSEHMTPIPQSDSTLAVHQSEHMTSIPQSDSTLAVHQSEHITSIPQSDSTLAVHQSEHITSIPQSDSTLAVHQSEHMTSIPQSDSTLTVAQYESFTTVPQDDLDSSNTHNVSELTTKETLGTVNDARRLYTYDDGQYKKVNANGSLSFSQDRTFSISMPECSIPAYFEAYEVLRDLPLYEFTDRSWLLCKSRIHNYIDNVKVTLNLTHTGICFFRVRSPPLPELSVGAVYDIRVHDCFTCATVNDGKNARNFGRLHKVIEWTIPSNIANFYMKPRYSQGRLTISVTAVPTCVKPRLQMKYPIHNSTG